LNEKANTAASEFVVNWDAPVRFCEGAGLRRDDQSMSATPSANAPTNSKPTRKFFPTGDACSLRFARTTADSYQTAGCASTFQRYPAHVGFISVSNMENGFVVFTACGRFGRRCFDANQGSPADFLRG
jgi:hypothetical protein